MQKSPFSIFWDWCFDGTLKTSIPIPEILLKYNTPITPMFLLKSMVRVGKLNLYLNTYMNNIGIHYIEKEDLFKFFKKCILDFKVKKQDISFSPYRAKDLLFDKMKLKFPNLKDYDITYLIDIINNSNEKDSVYTAFGIDKPKKEKVRSNKKSEVKKNDELNQDELITLDSFLKENFSWTEI